MIDGQMDGQLGGCTDGRTDGWIKIKKPYLTSLIMQQTMLAHELFCDITVLHFSNPRPPALKAELSGRLDGLVDVFMYRRVESVVAQWLGTCLWC